MLFQVIYLILFNIQAENFPLLFRVEGENNMKYPVNNLRNVCLLGHGGDGKTSLAEALLYYTDGIDRMGKTADGNTVCDYDPEEIARKISDSYTGMPKNLCRKNI